MFFNEFDHVLFWREREEAELAAIAMWEEHGHSDAFSAALNAWRKEQIPTKEAFYERVADYAAHGGPDQILIRREAKAISDSLEYATKASGESRVAMWREAVRKWAMHLEDYGAAVHMPPSSEGSVSPIRPKEGGPQGGGVCGQAILELCTGAGMGTWAVLSRLPEHSTLHSTDFDFCCPPNAVGIAKALGVEDRVAGLCANNWYLPFNGGIFDTVCTHYGLDESREVPTVLREVARVLKPGGRLVLIARMDPWDRQGKFFELFGAAKEDCRDVLRRVRLYSGPEDLIEDAARRGLRLTRRKDYWPQQGHARVLLVFER